MKLLRAFAILFLLAFGCYESAQAQIYNFGIWPSACVNTQVLFASAAPPTINCNSGFTFSPTNGATLGSPTGGTQGAGSLNAQSLFVNGVAVATGGVVTGNFTGTLTGCSSATTGQINYQIIGNIVTFWTNSQNGITCTSNTAAMTLTGIPVAIQPSVTSVMTNTIADMENATNATIGWGVFNTVSVITFSWCNMGASSCTATFGTSGTKGFASSPISYPLN